MTQPFAVRLVVMVNVALLVGCGDLTESVEKSVCESGVRWIGEDEGIERADTLTLHRPTPTTATNKVVDTHLIPTLSVGYSW